MGPRGHERWTPSTSLTPPRCPPTPAAPSARSTLPSGLLAGLFAAVAIVVVADMLNTKVRGEEDLEELLGVPVIGRIPAMKGGR